MEGGAGGSAEAHSALLLQIIFGCMTICLLLVVTLVATEGVHSGSAVRFAALLAYPVSMVAANICEQQSAWGRTNNVTLSAHSVLVLVLPFVVHWSYRCFFYSGGVHLLALVSPITGIVLDFVWYRNRLLFVAFTVLMLLSAGLDFHFHASNADDGLLADKRGLQPVFAMVAFYVTVGGVSCIAIGTMSFKKEVISQLSRNTQELLTSIIPKPIAEELIAQKLRRESEREEEEHLDKAAKPGGIKGVKLVAPTNRRRHRQSVAFTDIMMSNILRPGGGKSPVSFSGSDSPPPLSPLDRMDSEALNVFPGRGAAAGVSNPSPLSSPPALSAPPRQGGAWAAGRGGREEGGGPGGGEGGGVAGNPGRMAACRRSWSGA